MLKMTGLIKSLDKNKWIRLNNNKNKHASKNYLWEYIMHQ